MTKKESLYLHTFSINPRFSCSFYLPTYEVDENGQPIRIARTLNKTPNLAVCPSCGNQNWYFSKIQRHVECSKCKSKFQSPTFSINKANGIMSNKAKSTFRNAFNWMLLISNNKRVYSIKEKKYFTFKINFITLTLSAEQKHSDAHVKNNMLAPFLRWMAKSHNANSYIWKAEAQENGRIHFHITTNKFIHWKSIRSKWNKILAENGYCKVYQDGTNDKGNAASQVKAVKNLQSIECYMMKYMIKNEPDKRKIEGRLWAASENLNQSSLVIDELDENFYSVKQALLNPDNVRAITKPRFSIYLYNKKALSFLNPNIQQYFKALIKDMRTKDGIQTKVTTESFF